LSDISPVSPCFTPGTLIATERGQRPVETLRTGDKLVTRDNGLRRIYWIGRRTLTRGALRAEPDLQPILVRTGAFGDGVPSRHMLVSPSHRFLQALEPMPGEGVGGRTEVLIAARHLVDERRVRPAMTLGVSYIHLLCDRHQVILANGAWTESFHPDDRVFPELEGDQRQELVGLFPDIETIGASTRFPPARPIVEERSRFER
jgi:hypothetical protein